MTQDTLQNFANSTLQTGDISDASLRCLALVNTAFYYAALPRIYEATAIKFHNYATLEHAVNVLTSRPSGKHYRAYLRRLDVMSLPETWGQIGLTDSRMEPSHSPQLKEFIDISEFVPDSANSNPTGKILLNWRLSALDIVQPDPSRYEQNDWRPLISLLSTLNRLEVMNYAVGNNFPSSLLQAINHYHPTCQLNIWSTQNIALNLPDMGNVQSTQKSQLLEPFEIELFRSSCLHTIKIYYAYERDRELRTNIKQDAIIPLVAMAPNLRHLEIRSSSGKGIRKSNEKWTDFLTSFKPHSTEVSSQPPRPTTLSFRAGASASEPLMIKWSESFDFSGLQSLDMGRIKDVEEVASIFSQLQKLERLFINLDNPKRSDSQQPKSFQKQEYETIFGAINPLKYLRVKCLHDKSAIETILAHHGESLQSFIIEPGRKVNSGDYHRYHAYPVLVPNNISDIAQKAPRIRELRLTIERSKGSSEECLLYEALGAFSHLQNLALDLHYKALPKPGEIVRQPNPNSLNPREDYPTDRASIEKAFVNAAMDEALAREIWNLIYSKQHTRNLHNLRIVPLGWDLFHNKPERDILFHLSRSFLVSKGGIGQSGVEVVEIGRQERQFQIQRESLDRWREPNLTKTPPKRLRQIIRSLWGLSESQMEDWTQHWKSFPLHPNNQ